MKRWPLLITLLILTLLGGTPAAAQGPIVAPPPDVPPLPPGRGAELQLIDEKINVTIDGQLATTRVAQTFLNNTEWALEGEYLFPLPPDAAIQDMDMTVNGTRLEGELMTAQQAQAIYEEIVRQQLDPALLEWLGNGLFRTRIFPIPPGETRLIELEYTQLLTPENGLLNYRFPLRNAAAGSRVSDVSIAVTLEADSPLRAIYSPSHDVDVIREGENRAIVGWEARDVALDEDFSLFWSLSPEAIELNLLSFKEPGEDGFFLLLAAPAIEPQGRIVARDVVLVLDTSGSMEGEKLDQAKEALKFVLDRLNDEDRFNVIAFSTGTRRYGQRLQPASEATAAGRWVDDLVAAGSTDIDRALQEALSLGEGSTRPLLVIFMTDGLPTAGITDSQEIRRNAARTAPEQLRLFTFGVGFDVDTVLLDALAGDHGGTSSYVTPDERIDEVVSAFYEKVSAPVMTDISLDWGNVLVEEQYPSPLPDLFAGQQLVLVGRYREGGPVTLRLSGEVNGEEQTLVYDDLRLATSDESREAWLPRLWATRKVGSLLLSIRRNGESREAVEEVIDLAIRYGIVTPYTTFLVEEEPGLFDDAFREQAADEALSAAPPAVTGAEAVEEAEASTELSLADRAAPSLPTPAEGQGQATLRSFGAKTFVRGPDGWLDTAYEVALEREQVLFGSDRFFEIARAHPEVGRYLSAGFPLTVVLDGQAYLIVEDPDFEPVARPTWPPALEPATATPLPTVEPTPDAIAAAIDATREPGTVERQESTAGTLADTRVRIALVLAVVAIVFLLLGGVMLPGRGQ